MTDLQLRPVTRAQLVLVSEFFAAPHVARWWREDPALEAIEARYAPLLAGQDGTVLLLAWEADRAVGLVQWYLWSEQDAAPYGLPVGTVGIDYLIGHPRDCERGLGTALVAAVLEQVPSGAVWVTPEAANGPSCRVLEKNGFELMAVKQCHVPDEPWAGPTALYRLER